MKGPRFWLIYTSGIHYDSEKNFLSFIIVEYIFFFPLLIGHKKKIINKQNLFEHSAKLINREMKI